MKFARIVYALAGIWSLLVLKPLFFLYQTIGSASPPPITHPEYYFGFLCVALAWAAVFFIIAADPEGMRKMMIAAVIEKIGYGLVSFWLFFEGKTQAGQLGFTSIDLSPWLPVHRGVCLCESESSLRLGCPLGPTSGQFPNPRSIPDSNSFIVQLHLIHDRGQIAATSAPTN